MGLDLRQSSGLELKEVVVGGEGRWIEIVGALLGH